MVLKPHALMERLLQRKLLHYGGALVARGLEVIGKFGLYMLAARLMGGHDSGLFFLCLAWVNLSSTAARMGLERAMSRHIAAELAVGHGHAARRAMLTGLGWTALASLSAGGVTLLTAAPAAHFLFHQDDVARPLMIAALILPPQTLAFAVGFVLVGLNRGVAAQMVQSALPPLLSLGALLAGLNQLDMVLSVYACSYTVCCLIGVCFIVRDWHRKMIEQDYTGETAPEALPSLWTTARPFLTIELVQVSLLSLPVLMLGVFADARSVSEFSIVSRLAMLITTILVSVALIAAPAFARHHRRHEYEQLRRVERQTRLLAMAVCLPAIAIMLIFPKLLLSQLGSDFAAASTALIVLALGQIVNTLLPTQDMMLSMTGHGRTLRRLNLQQLLACVVLSAILIPGFGLMGAAVLSSVCLVQGRVSFALAVRRVLPELSAPRRPVAA